MSKVKVLSVSEWVSQWQGHLLSCCGQLKTHTSSGWKSWWSSSIRVQCDVSIMIMSHDLWRSSSSAMRIPHPIGFQCIRCNHHHDDNHHDNLCMLWSPYDDHHHPHTMRSLSWWRPSSSVYDGISFFLGMPVSLWTNMLACKLLK